MGLTIDDIGFDEEEKALIAVYQACWGMKKPILEIVIIISVEEK